MTDRLQYIFIIFYMDPVSAKPNMLDDLVTFLIGKLICGDFWDIFTTAFDLHKHASNTKIISLCKDGIK